MKRWAKVTIQGILGGGAGILLIVALAVYSPFPRQAPKGARDAKTIHGWLVTWAGEHGGNLPDKVEDVTKIDIGADASLFPPIIEYRGAGKNINTTPPDTLLLRYRAGKKGELEARASAGGSVVTKKPDAWVDAEATQ